MLGSKIPEKINFSPKISKSKSPKILNYTKGTKLAYYLYAKKKIREKKLSSGLWRGHELFDTFFQKKSKKRTLNRCRRLKFSFHEK
jgi:hypothetical protein